MSPATASATAKPFMVHVSLTFILITMVSSAMIAFSVGQIARQMIMNDGNIFSTAMNSNTLNIAPSSYNTIEDNHPEVLPHPKLANGKRVPRTIYTSKNYDTGRSVTSDSLLARHALNDKDEWVIVPEDALPGATKAVEEEEDDEEEEELHEPSGQHLLIDIEHIDSMFLNSKERLAQAMIELVELSGLTLLSYHCHGLEPMGVSCAGVLLESHVSFHTWPIPGVITLDLFTCGPKSLVPLVPLIKKLFAKPQEDSDLEPHMLWSFKRRGFRDVEGFDAGSVDLYNMLLGVMEFEQKTQIASVQTDFQSVEIYDVIHPRFTDIQQYKKSLLNNDSYESKNRELYQPDRIVYLDGVMQSRRYGDAGYHEALVHPAMFAVPEPKTVVIIGGGEGATMREVLKHKSVTKVVMVEIDEKMVSVSREHLPDWSDCSDFIPGIKSCFDDPRVEVIFSDAIQWFIDNFGKDRDQESKYGEVDVIIMDALDPGDNVAFSDMLFNNGVFADSLFNSLSDEGLFVCQTGRSFDLDEAPLTETRYKHGFNFKDRLANAGFESIVEYEAPHGGFMGVWSFFVAFSDSDSKRYWYHNEAEVNLEIQKRIHSKITTGTTGSYKSTMSLKYFDGATMQSYHFPSKAQEVVFCRNFPDTFGCSEEGATYLEVKHGFDPDILDVSIDKFEVKESTIENAGRGIFTTMDIPKGSYIGVGEGSRDIHVTPTTYSLIYNFMDAFKDGAIQDSRWNFFDPFLYGYGFANFFFGGEDRSVDVGIAKFMNHGCDGSWNIGLDSDITEMNADENNFDGSDKKWAWEDDVHNPFRDRSARILMHTVDVARRDIAAGEEILDNFLNYASTEEMWHRAVLDLRAQCTKESLGVITSYEKNEAANENE